MISRDARVFVGGRRGVAGGALVRHREADGFTNVRSSLDLVESSQS